MKEFDRRVLINRRVLIRDSFARIAFGATAMVLSDANHQHMESQIDAANAKLYDDVVFNPQQLEQARDELGRIEQQAAEKAKNGSRDELVVFSQQINQNHQPELNLVNSYYLFMDHKAQTRQSIAQHIGYGIRRTLSFLCFSTGLIHFGIGTYGAATALKE